MKTFKDLETGLEWLLEDFGPMTWDKAMKLDIDGFKLPTKEQLLTLVDGSKFDPACSKPVDILSNYYWTSMSYKLDTTSAWSTAFYVGGIYNVSKTNNFYVRLVRPIKGKG